MDEIDLSAIEALCKAARLSELDGMFVTENDMTGIAELWYPDGDYLAGIEDNMGVSYLENHELAELIVTLPTILPALVAELREARERVGELEKYRDLWRNDHALMSKLANQNDDLRILLHRVLSETGSYDGAITHGLIDAIGDALR